MSEITKKNLSEIIDLVKNKDIKSEELTQFLQDAAAEGIKMRIMDENGKVMAYSNGDGKLYHADNGLKFETGDSLRSSDMFLDEFIAQQTEQAQQNALPTMKP